MTVRELIFTIKYLGVWRADVVEESLGVVTITAPSKRIPMLRHELKKFVPFAVKVNLKPLKNALGRKKFTYKHESRL